MIEAPFYFFKIEMEVFLRHSSVMIEPMFGIRPEAFYAISVHHNGIISHI